MSTHRGFGDFVARHYHSLHDVAARLLQRERAGVSLLPTDLLHTVYRQLADRSWVRARHSLDRRNLVIWKMRRVLIDRARRQKTEMHGGHLTRVPFAEALRVREFPSEAVAGLADALDQLGRVPRWGPRARRLLELRYVNNYQVLEAAEIVGIRRETAQREIRRALDWLRTFLDDEHPPSGRSTRRLCRVSSKP